MSRSCWLVALLLLACFALMSSVQGQTSIVQCDDPYDDCSYEGDGAGVEFICTNGGSCFCNNAEICNCMGNDGDCNCGYATTCYCNGNDGDCCYTAAGYPEINTNDGNDWETSDGVCYGDSSSDDGTGSITLIVVGTTLGLLLIILVAAAIVRRRRYYASLESRVVYAPVPSYSQPVAYNPYQVPPPQAYAPNPAGYTTTPQYPNPNYYPTNNYSYTVSSNERR